MKFPDLRYQRTRRTREELIAHMQSFRLDPKLSVGIWYFTPGGGRFHERYVPEAGLEERLEMAAGLAKYGVKGIEAHYPNEVNEDNLHLYNKLEEEAGIRLVAVGFAHFYDRDFEFGSMSNPDPAVRSKAVDIAESALRLVKETGAQCAISWPGIDGYTYPLGTVFQWMWDWFEESLAEAMDRVPGTLVTLEPKPYEPAPNNIYRTTAEGVLAAQRVEARMKNAENRKLLEEGHALVALNPEIGHVRMGFEEAAAAYALCGSMYGRLGHVHLNSQPAGNYDQDLNVGVVEWQQAEALLFVLKMMGYKEWYGIDINPERMPVDKAIEINARVLEIMNDRLEKLPVEQLVDCYLDPANHRGEIELIMAEHLRK